MVITLDSFYQFSQDYGHPPGRLISSGIIARYGYYECKQSQD